ncbi:hypothetical protein KNE206_13200 [Kitasatospora sp. NE20-6]
MAVNNRAAPPMTAHTSCMEERFIVGWASNSAGQGMKRGRVTGGGPGGAGGWHGVVDATARDDGEPLCGTDDIASRGAASYGSRP